MEGHHPKLTGQVELGDSLGFSLNGLALEDLGLVTNLACDCGQLSKEEQIVAIRRGLEPIALQPVMDAKWVDHHVLTMEPADNFKDGLMARKEEVIGAQDFERDRNRFWKHEQGAEDAFFYSLVPAEDGIPVREGRPRWAAFELCYRRRTHGRAFFCLPEGSSKTRR
jgi:hypothetical protein